MPIVLPSAGLCQSRGTWTVAQARPLTVLNFLTVSSATPGKVHSSHLTVWVASAPASARVSGSCFAAALAVGVSTTLVAINTPVTAAMPPLKYCLTVDPFLPPTRLGSAVPSEGEEGTRTFLTLAGDG